MHRGEIGVKVQTVTPELAAGLGLKQDWGAILGDVEPDGPADDAGLATGDIVVSLNGKPVENARQFEVGLFKLRIGDAARISVLRGESKLDMTVKVKETDDDPFRFADLVKPETNTVKRLGIVGIPITQDVAAIVSDTRFKYGVIVAAKAGVAEYNGQGGLNPGDIIYTVNTRPVSTLEALRGALDQLKPGDPLVVQIERNSRLLYLILSDE